MPAVVEQKLAPFTFFVTSSPLHMEAHLAAHLPLWGDDAAHASAVRDIASHIKSYFPQHDSQREVIVCNTNDMEQLQSEAPHFFYDLSAQRVVSQQGDGRGFLLRISFFGANTEAEGSAIAPLEQWQKDAHKTLLQVMAETPFSAKTTPSLRAALSSLSRLRYLIQAKKSGTKWHDVAQVMSRADLQIAIAFAVDGARQSLAALCNNQIISSTSQIKIRGRINKLEGISRLQLKASPRVATIVNTKNSLQKLAHTSPAPGVTTKRNTIHHAEQETVAPPAPPQAIKSFRASAITPFAQHVAKAKAAARQAPQAVTDFRRVTKAVSPIARKKSGTLKPVIVSAASNVNQVIVTRNDAGQVSHQSIVQQPVALPVTQEFKSPSIPVKEAQAKIPESVVAPAQALPAMAIVTGNDVGQVSHHSIVQQAIASPVTQERESPSIPVMEVHAKIFESMVAPAEVLPDLAPLIPTAAGSSPVIAEDIKAVSAPAAKDLRNRVIKTDIMVNIPHAHDVDNLPKIATTKKTEKLPDLVEEKREARPMAVVIPREDMQQAHAPEFFIPAAHVETAIPKMPQYVAEAPVQLPVEAPEKQILQKALPVIEGPKLPAPLTVESASAPIATAPVIPAALPEHNDTVEEIPHQYPAVENVVPLSRAKLTENASGETDGDPELARLKRLKKARQYTQYGMC